MKVLFGKAGFSSNNRRNQARNRLQTEVTARGLTPYALDFGAPYGVVSGFLDATVEGQPGLVISYSGDDAVVEQAVDELYRWLDANGFVEGDFGHMMV